jgi:hypothetical protein
MLCVSCRQRKGKRQCPALGGLICTVCCGTKRLKEINCPADCQYLASAQAHPPAAVMRQRERDLPLLATLLEGLTPTQADLLTLFQAQMRSHRATAIPPLRDVDVRDAAASLAATLETAAKGIVYEHQPASIPAMRLMRAWQDMLADIERHAASSGAGAGAVPRPSVIASVLRRTEQAARDAAKTLGLGGPDKNDTAADTAYLDFLDRVMRRAAHDRDHDRGVGIVDAGAPTAAPDEGPRIILP